MRKMGKTRKGFTLVEMVLVIAIIVILAGVLVVGIGTYLNKAASAAFFAFGKDITSFETLEQIAVRNGLERKPASFSLARVSSPLFSEAIFFRSAFISALRILGISCTKRTTPITPKMYAMACPIVIAS